jgi:hypothetical protein
MLDGEVLVGQPHADHRLRLLLGVPGCLHLRRKNTGTV